MVIADADLITQTRACREYGFDKRTLRRRIADGTVPAYADTFDRRTLLVRRTDLDRLRCPKPIPTNGEPVAAS